MMKHPVKIAVLVLFALASELGAQGNSWLGFENGKKLFREGRYAEALVAFRGVVAERRDVYGRALVMLDSALGSGPARYAGDSMDKVMSGFMERDFIETEIAALERESGGSLRKKIELLRSRRIADGFRNYLEALSLALEERPVSTFADSVASLRREIGRLGSFPEAEYWIGLVFMQEGEYALARIQFERAVAMADSYRVPDDRFTVLYELSSVYRTEGRMRDCESALLAVADADPLFADGSKDYLRARMMETLTEPGSRAGFDKFISLYRIKSPFALRAFDELGTFYLESNRDDRALLYLAAAVDIVCGNIIESVSSDDPGFVFETVAGLLETALRKPAIVAYAESVDLFRLLYRLGEALERKNAAGTARTVYAIVADGRGAGVWGNRARNKLAR